MIKNIFCMLMMLLMTTSFWAAGQRDGNAYLTFSGGSQVGIQDILSEKEEGQPAISGYTVGVETKSMDYGKMGWGSSSSVFIPEEITLCKFNSDEEVIIATRDNYDVLFGMDMTVGTVFMPVRNDRWGLSLMHGMHMGYLFASNESVSMFTLLLGVGAELSLDIYLGEHLYLNGGMAMSYDFYALSEVISPTPYGHNKIETESGPASYLTVRPKVGIGYRW